MVKILAKKFSVESSLIESGVYILKLNDGRIGYIGETINFYQRMSTFKMPIKFSIEDVDDIYFFSLAEEYRKGVEAVFIGLFKPYENKKKYPCFHLWKQLIVNNEQETIKFNLAYHHSCFLPNELNLMQLIMSCKYKIFSRRIDSDSQEKYTTSDWLDINSKDSGYAVPFIDLLNESLMIGVTT